MTNYITHNGNIVGDNFAANSDINNLIKTLSEAQKANLISHDTYQFMLRKVFVRFMNEEITKKTDYFSKVFDKALENAF